MTFGLWLLFATQTLAAPTGDDLRRFAVPPSVFSPACRLVANPSRELGNHQVAVGLWGNLRVDRNPWFGSDPGVIAAIHLRLSAAAPMAPDGPPLDRRQSAAFFRKLADGIEEAHAAFYEAGPGEWVTVYALRFADSQRAAALAAPRKGEEGHVRRLAAGNIVWSVAGPDTECRHRIFAYLQSLDQKVH